MTPLETSILCRAAIVLPASATGEFQYMPGGLQTITPFDGGIGQPIKVMVDAAGAAQLEAQRRALAAKGKRAFFDFNHEDGPASFWPTEFFWRDTPEPGIYCRGEWSASGKAGVEGREWRQFSPVFHVDNKRGNPARIVCREQAKPNMGGLVNDPAFHTILPLWAKDAGAASDQQNQNQNQNADTSMNEQELAALRAKNQELQTELDGLNAKNADAAAIAAKAAELRAAKAELAAEEARKENEALKAKNEALEAADKAAAFAVRQLLQAPKFRELEARWRSLDWLLRRVDSDVAVKVAVIDLSEAELRADLDRENLAESALYELLVARPKVRPGEAGWQALVLDLQFGSRIADIELLGRWSQIATDANAKLLVGLRDEAVGCVAAQPFTPAEFSEASAAWNSLQQLPDTAKACAVWPGFILRQPYGKQSSEVESLELEELANVEHPQGVLLFGSGAYLAAAILIRGQEDDSSNDFTGLPCVVLKDSAGQKQMVPASGWWLREGALEHLNALGVTVAYALPQAGALRMFPLRNLQGNLL